MHHSAVSLLISIGIATELQMAYVRDMYVHCMCVSVCIYV